MTDDKVNFDSNSLQAKFDRDKELVIVLPLLQGRLLHRMMTHLTHFDKAQKQNQFTGFTGKFKKFLLLAEGICLSVFTSIFFSNVAEIFDFFMLNRRKIKDIFEERIGDKKGKIVYIRR